MRKQSHSPDRAVIPSRSHPSVIGAEHGSTLIFLRNEGSRERCVIVSGIALAFALDFRLSTVNFFLSPLQSALTQIALVTPLQSADPKTRHLKSFRIRTSKKRRGEGVNC
jgi:hypothetical protein